MQCARARVCPHFFAHDHYAPPILHSSNFYHNNKCAHLGLLNALMITIRTKPYQRENGAGNVPKKDKNRRGGEGSMSSSTLVMAKQRADPEGGRLGYVAPG